SPPATQPRQFHQLFDTVSFGPQLPPAAHDPFTYQKALLKRLNFVLDIEAASAFPQDVDLVYSWGKPDYHFTQFIHKSGTLLAQITAEGDFLLLANRLCNARATPSRDKESHKYHNNNNNDNNNNNGAKPVVDALGERRGGGAATAAPAVPPHTVATMATPQMRAWSPFSSPVVRAVGAVGELAHPPQPPPPHAQPSHLSQHYSSSWSLGGGGGGGGGLASAEKKTQSPEDIKDDVEAFCNDVAALRAFYEDVGRPKASPSPLPHPYTARAVATGGGFGGVVGGSPQLQIASGSPRVGLGIGATIPEGSIPALGLPPSLAGRGGGGGGVSGVGRGNGGGGKGEGGGHGNGG
ncbi:hypothetical protein LTS18_005252, partial [Coniosporium uncinatum]